MIFGFADLKKTSAAIRKLRVPSNADKIRQAKCRDALALLGYQPSYRSFLQDQRVREKQKAALQPKKMDQKKQPTTKQAAKDAPLASVQSERSIEPSETQTGGSQEEAWRTEPLTKASHESEVQADVAADTAELAEEEAWQAASLMGFIYDDTNDAAPAGLHPDPNAAGQTGEVQSDARTDGVEDDIPLVERKRRAAEESKETARLAKLESDDL